MPDDAPVTRTVRPLVRSTHSRTSPEPCDFCAPRALHWRNRRHVFGVSEGSRTPDLQDHNLAL